MILSNIQTRSLITANLEDTSIKSFRLINSKNIFILKTDNVPIKFIYSMVDFILIKMKNIIEQCHLKESEEEKNEELKDIIYNRGGIEFTHEGE